MKLKTDLRNLYTDSEKPVSYKGGIFPKRERCREVGLGRKVRVSLLLTVWFAEWQPEHLVTWPWGRHSSPVRQALFPTHNFIPVDVPPQ